MAKKNYGQVEIRIRCFSNDEVFAAGDEDHTYYTDPDDLPVMRP